MLIDRGDFSPKTGQYYAVREGDYAELKQITVEDDEHLRVEPRSYDQETFKPRIVHMADLAILGRVVWSGVTWP